MTFGEAIEKAKAGARIRRQGWYNTHNAVIFVAGSSVTLSAGSAYAKHCGDGAAMSIGAHFDMLIAGSSSGYVHAQPGWLASQADMLADDWLAL